ncbi:MAG: hypothetical protein DRP56_09650, partial [Planctomycetota bacterium]
MPGTGIGYGDERWNPVTGCGQPISAGCEHCWARRMAKHLAEHGFSRYQGGDPFRPRFHPERLDEPKNSPGHWIRPRRVLVCFMGDLWYSGVHPDWRWRIFERVESVRHHTYLFLTKRPGRMVAELKSWWRRDTDLRRDLSHCWFGTTVEKQEYLYR